VLPAAAWKLGVKLIKCGLMIADAEWRNKKFVLISVIRVKNLFYLLDFHQLTTNNHERPITVVTNYEFSLHHGKMPVA
jgi:hypothetical protein